MRHCTRRDVEEALGDLWSSVVADVDAHGTRAVVHVTTVEPMDEEILSGRLSELLGDLFEADGAVVMAGQIEQGGGGVFEATFVITDTHAATPEEAVFEAKAYRATLDRFEIRMLIDGAKARRGRSVQ